MALSLIGGCRPPDPPALFLGGTPVGSCCPPKTPREGFEGRQPPTGGAAASQGAPLPFTRTTQLASAIKPVPQGSSGPGAGSPEPGLGVLPIQTDQTPVSNGPGLPTGPFGTGIWSACMGNTTEGGPKPAGDPILSTKYCIPCNIYFILGPPSRLPERLSPDILRRSPRPLRGSLGDPCDPWLAVILPASAQLGSTPKGTAPQADLATTNAAYKQTQHLHTKVARPLKP